MEGEKLYMNSGVADSLKHNGIPVTRESWIKLNWMGEEKYSLPPELEAELPEELQKQE